MRNVLYVTKALADETRLRALCALNGRELCVCQLIELLDLAPSTVSKHMSILRQAGLVEGRKSGRWMYYRLPEAGETTEGCFQALCWALGQASASKQAQADLGRLKAIVCEGPAGEPAGGLNRNQEDEKQ